MSSKYDRFRGFPFINFFSINFSKFDVFDPKTFNYAYFQWTNIANISNTFCNQFLSTPDDLSIVLTELVCNVAVSRLFKMNKNFLKTCMFRHWKEMTYTQRNEWKIGSEYYKHGIIIVSQGDYSIQPLVYCVSL